MYGWVRIHFDSLEIITLLTRVAFVQISFNKDCVFASPIELLVYVPVGVSKLYHFGSC